MADYVRHRLSQCMHTAVDDDNGLMDVNVGGVIRSLKLYTTVLLCWPNTVVDRLYTRSWEAGVTQRSMVVDV